VGREYGSVTGRPRRCGWLDVVALRYALELNGAGALVLTNLDVLSAFDGIAGGPGDEGPGRREPGGPDPAHPPRPRAIRPPYQRRPGGRADISAVRRFADLPRAAREYVEWVQQRIAIPIELVSVGPEREAVIPRGR